MGRRALPWGATLGGQALPWGEAEGRRVLPLSVERGGEAHCEAGRAPLHWPPWRPCPRTLYWSARFASTTTAPAGGPSCWTASTPAARYACSRWGPARRTCGAPGAAGSPSCRRGTLCRSCPMTLRWSPLLRSPTPRSTPPSSSNSPAMGATCCLCPCPRRGRYCRETSAAASCPAASRSPWRWWRSQWSSSRCRAASPPRGKQRNRTAEALWKAPPGPEFALWSWWPASWSFSWASSSTTCRAFPSASRWSPAAEPRRRVCSLRGWVGLGWVGGGGDEGEISSETIHRSFAQWLQNAVHRGSGVLAQPQPPALWHQAPRQHVENITSCVCGGSGSEDCMCHHNHLSKGLRLTVIFFLIVLRD